MFPPSARAIVSARKNIEYLGVQNYTEYNVTPNSSYTGNRYWNPETDDGIFNDQSTTCATGYNAESCYCCGQNPYFPYECYTCEATYVYFNGATFTLYSSLTGGYYHTSGNLNRTGWKYIQSIMPYPNTTWSTENCTYNNCTNGYASEKAYIYANNQTYFNGYGAQAEGGVRDAGSIGIKYDNTLWAWGETNFMYWMAWNVGHKYSPYQIGTDTWLGFAPRVQAPAGPVMNTFLGIKTNGTLWAWGNNNGLGTLGNNSIANTVSPVQIGTGTDWKYVQYCYNTGATAALKTDGTLWMWGSNQYGQLGVGNTVNRSSPVQVGTGTNWARVMTGYYTTLAVKTDGTLWGWGYNGYGAIGDGTTTNRSSPVQIGTGTNWSKIRVGYIAANAIKTDGTLWGWSYAGRYGTTDTVKSSPVQMGGSNSDHADFIHDTINSENAITINTNKQMLQYYAFGSATRYSAAVLAGPYYQTGDDFQLQKVSFSNQEGWFNILKSGTL